MLRLVCLLACAGSAFAQGELTVVDSQGALRPLKTWRYVTGTRKLAWLPEKTEALELREENSTSLVQGILTFVPLENIQSIDFDAAKKTVAVNVLVADGKTVTLTGTTKFLGINKIAIETDVDLGDFGKAAALYVGGAERNGIRAIRFPNPKPAAVVPQGKLAKIVGLDKEKSKHEAVGLTPLYQTGPTWETKPHLHFKPTTQIEFANVVRLKYHPPIDKKQPAYYELAAGDGNMAKFVLLETPKLAGLVGRVPAGYRLFPLHTIAELLAEK